MGIKSCGRTRARGRGGEGEKGHRELWVGEIEEKEQRRMRMRRGGEQENKKSFLQFFQGKLLCIFLWTLKCCLPCMDTEGGAARWRLRTPSFMRSMTQTKPFCPNHFFFFSRCRPMMNSVIPWSGLHLHLLLIFDHFQWLDLSSRYFWRTG